LTAEVNRWRGAWLGLAALASGVLLLGAAHLGGWFLLLAWVLLLVLWIGPGVLKKRRGLFGTLKR